MESKKVKRIIICISFILAVISVLAFSMAVYKGCTAGAPTVTEHPIQVYINDNDSVVKQLQNDVEQLTKILEDMQTDSLIITVGKVKR